MDKRREISTKKKGTKSTGRPKPVSGKGSYTKTDRRYGCGGRIKK